MNTLSAQLLILLAVVPPASQSPSPQPRFTGQRVYVAEEPDVYDAVRAEAEKLSAASPQSYYVVVVRSAGRGATATRDYTDNLYQRWVQQAAEQHLKLDPDRSVLIVLAVGNRQLSVHAGAKLQGDYGLRDQTIDRELVGPQFLPYARSGNYAAGLTVLLQKIDQWIREKDAAQVRRREEAAKRAEQIRADARTTLEGAERLQGEVGKSLAEKHLNLDLGDLQARVEEAGKTLAEARRQLPSNAEQALHDGQQARTALQQAQSELFQRESAQAQAAAQFDQLERTIRDVEGAIDTQHRAGLAVAPVQQRLEKLLAQESRARQALRSRPQEALQQGLECEQMLRALRAETNGLGELRRQMRQRAEAVSALRQKVEAELAHAKGAGASVSAIESELATAADQLQHAEELQQTDYAQALGIYQSVEAGLKPLPARLEALYQQRRFATRTLPMMLTLGLLGMAMAALAVQRWRHLRRKRSAVQRLAAFKQQVVQLSDTLDALQERHKMLPFSDPDFTEPMGGDTLALYGGVQETIRRYRERWLELMGAWEKADSLIAAESPLGTQKSREAEKSLADATAAEVLQAVDAQARVPLDRLGQAHEVAEQSLASLRAEAEKLRARVEAIQQAGLAVSPYRAAMDSLGSQAERAQGSLRADPIGAQAVLEQGRRDAAALDEWTQRILLDWQQAQKAEDSLRKATELAVQRRAEGLLLREDRANPNPLLAAGGEHRSAAIELLNRGDAEKAEAQLQRAFESADRAVQAVESQVKAKADCEAGIPTRRTEAGRLREAVRQAQADQQQLEQQFAQESWQAVAENVTEAVGLLDGTDAQLNAAQGQSDLAVQQYLSAAELLLQAEHGQSEAALLLDAVSARLRELTGLREQCQAGCREVQGVAQRIGELLRANTADRPRANQRYQAAGSLLADVLRDAAAPRPDWVALARRLAEARGELDRAEQLAREDIRLAEQALAEIAEAQQEIRRAGTFYSEGYSANVSPAEAILAQAATTLQSQAYESAIQQANEAVSAARQAYQRAVEQAAWKQQQREAERRRRAARHSSSSTLGGFGSGSSSSSSSSSSTSSSSWSSSSGSSSSSWSSGTSQSSW